MGFRQGGYAYVWDVKPQSNICTQLRISVSRKNKDTGDYDQDFSGFVRFMGTANAAKAAQLTPGTSIKLGDVDVSTKYVKDKNVEYVNYKCFSFEVANGSNIASQPVVDNTQKGIDDGEIDDSGLPF